MQIEVIGAITILCGLIGWLGGPRIAVPTFFASTLLSAAAAMILTALGGANIQPAHLLLGFLALSILVSQRGAMGRARQVLTFPNPGFWLLLTAAYATLSAVFLPRLLAGTTYVFAIARTELGPGIISMPLGPTSGNATQSIYFLGDLVCFLLFYVIASRPDGVRFAVNAAIATSILNLCFAAIDFGSYVTGLGDVLAFIRNGNYRMLDAATVLGFKRIVGSFPETSTFAYFTAGFFAFCTRLWLGGIRPRLTGPIALGSLLTLAYSTSSTGYVATCGFLALLFAVCAVQALSRPVGKTTLILVTIFPLIVAVGLTGLRLYTPAWNVVGQLADASLFEKLNSSSGIEREKWNDQALINFSDTDGLGAGQGSVRASSFPIAVLSNIGIFGAATYALFLVGLFGGRRDRWQHPFPASCQSAARWACIAQLLGASVAGSFIDLGLPFFIFAGVACAGPAARTRLTAPSHPTATAKAVS
jgi:hypothetical protein